jgi:hypothetical protein
MNFLKHGLHTLIQIFSDISNLVRRTWLEIGITLLILLTLWTITHPSPTSTPAVSLVNAAFALPSSKIQSDISVLHIGDHIAVLLVINQQTTRYDAMLLQIRRANDSSLPTPYAPESATTVTIQLLQATNNTVVNFASQLPDASAIYLFQLKS